MAEKLIELRKVPCGETFTAFGEEFIVLDHIDGGVLSIRKSIWKNTPFDARGTDDLRTASVGKELEAYINTLKDAGARLGDIQPMVIDLKAADGTREYGYYRTMIGLLTLEQYGKYKDIIPLAGCWWWLATPWETRWPCPPYMGVSATAWFVYTNGSTGCSGCTNTGGVRPVLNFTSCILVVWNEDGEEAGHGFSEEESK